MHFIQLQEVSKIGNRERVHQQRVHQLLGQLGRHPLVDLQP